MEGRIGEVFTPLAWGRWAASRFGLLDKWLAGASVLDPTMGDGALLEALVAGGLERGLAPAELPVERLFGVELRDGHRDAFLARIAARYGIAPPDRNFTAADIFALENGPRADLLFGNPPWETFAGLPDTYKPFIREKFVEYGLVASGRNVLLGKSRADIAGLVVAKTVVENLLPGGEAVFFLPLSLFFGEGANSLFRSFVSKGVRYRVDAVYDLEGTGAFPEVSTRCGVVRLRRDEAQSYPVEYWTFGGSWERAAAGPLHDAAAPWSVGSEGGSAGLLVRAPEPVEVPRESVPRQGVNTSGANDLFFFDAAESAGGGLLRLSNAAGNEAVLPEEFVFPCITAGNFSESAPEPRRWVFLPYREDGKPLAPEEVERDPALRDYLGRHRERLAARKGVLVNSWIERGFPWALLGVGPYCFFPHKIAWEAYGRKRFAPKVFSGRWQANQALQCYMPFRSREACEAAAGRLSSAGVEPYLLSLGRPGTMNWAQPGRIRRLLRLV